MSCSVEHEVTAVEQETGATPCPPWMCLNSPDLLVYGIHELSVFATPTAKGIHFEKYGDAAALYINGQAGKLAVEDNRFIGYDDNGFRLKGQQLVGAEMHVRGDDGPLFNLRITNVREIDFPVGDQEPVEVYRILWYVPGSNAQLQKSICNGPVAYDAKGDDYGMARDETLIFTGDRIDRDNLQIKPDDSHEWINFGCGMQTLAKLHLTRNTTSARGTKWEANQATLKMFAGDYCGKGVSLTVAGTPYRWRGGEYVKDFASTPYKLEARWNENGATCINALRLDYHPAAAFPDPWTELKEHCEVKWCDDTDVDKFDGAYRVSGIVL